MELNKQVCSLELAKKLKELQRGQESSTLFWWWEVTTIEGEEKIALNQGYVFKQYPVKSAEMIGAAYTIPELGELLKPYMNSIQISARDDIFNPDFWANVLIHNLASK